MKKYTFEDIERVGLLLYKFYRGSHVQGIATEKSDWDEGGVYIEPIEQLLGLGYDFQEEISDEKHDKVWYGLRKYMHLLTKSNPSILESLFIDDKFVLYEHPIMTDIKKHRQDFVTKACFKPFLSYSYSQIQKCRSYNKLCANPIEKRLCPLDFCYTTYKQGTINIREWLKERGLEQGFCGLVSLNNMPMCYYIFYDFGAHNLEKYHGNFENFKKDESYYNFIASNMALPAKTTMEEWFNEYQKAFGYRGIVREDGKSDEVRCSSVDKNAMPFCVMTYNQNGFELHCRKYKEYQTWLKKRNPVRYESNHGYLFDSKNVAHAFRLLNMGLEIARTGEVHVDRTGRDAKFLLGIRNHEYSYEYLIDLLEGKKGELEEAIQKSTIPEAIPIEAINNILLNIRKKYQIKNILL